MALFGGKKETSSRAAKPASARTARAEAPAAPQSESTGASVAKGFDPIISPYITEKAALASESNTYVFIVDRRATKQDIKRAIHEKYSFTPLKVNIARKAARSVRRRGGSGVKRGFTKAYVQLKKGETIDLM